MEEKRKDTAAQTPASSASGATTGTPPKPSEMAAAAEPTSSRRRGQKRKANNNNNNNSGNTSTPQTASSKRQARDKPPAIPFTPIHNGPCTRARQPPNPAATSAASVACVASSSVGAALDVKSEAEAAESGGGGEAMEALETKVEAEYEVIRSRDANAHVVPIPCGWFSWTKVHPLEERTLPSFFNRKSESRTPEIYMEIRNWIMKKFHTDPNLQIELKDLSELSVGELDARQEVMEFLDYWGLINYHPLLDTDSATDNADDTVAVKSLKTNSLLEKLYRFEVENSYVPAVPRPNAATPTVPSGLFPESAITEEARPEGPSVEYHCNSCAADCSRKRYHCQKQADFDLCSECFINGKFGSNMLPSDFILMEPAEAPGVIGGKWTDQETLLLLEALELYKENWNEIAEHVATKTKAQCILHFVQMPIEDTFLDCDDEFYASVKGNSDPVSSNIDSSTPKDAHEITETKTGTSENLTLTSAVKSSKPEEADELKVGENCALKALKEAFEAVGSLPKPGEKLSFSEAGNPVMALAAFLVHMVDPNVATASVHNSLKSITGKSSGTHLAARHCFLLEDPPDDKKKSPDADRALTETDGWGAQKDENRSDETQKGENSNSVVDGTDLANDHNNEKNKDSVEEEKVKLVSPNGECTDKPQSANEADIIATREKGRPGILNESDNPDLLNDQAPISMDESDSLISPAERPVNDSKEPSMEEPSQCTDAPKDEEMVPDSLPLEKKEPEHPVTSNLVDSGANTGEEEAPDCMPINEDPSETKSDLHINKLKRAAVTAISAAAVKAKLLANQEEDQIRQLASLLVEKQLHKLENKLVFFNEMESVVMRVREQMERSRQRLYHERAQIIAARLGLPASSSRPMQQSSVTNRVAMSFANSAPKPPMSMTSQRPPISRPMMTSLPPTSIPFVPATVAGNSVRPSNQEKLSSVGTK